ncbi:hypothetical protein L249_7069, partial [Ophiocordyceps polyrhachis-furcata BCC 54312]
MAPSAAPPDRAPGDTVGVPIVIDRGPKGIAQNLSNRPYRRFCNPMRPGRNRPRPPYSLPLLPHYPRDYLSSVRVVTRAYRATPLHYVESEAFVPPLDLYLSYCSARTFQLLEANSIAAGIRAAYARGRGRVPSSRTLLPPPPAAATPSSTNTLSSSTTTSSLCLLAGTFITSLSLSLLRSRGADPIRSAPSPPSIFSGVRAASGIYTIGAPLTL